ncbi:MAG: potassium transporter TrkA [Candidatus Diapherotrites archaeon]|uniref:Potassium transporter TrkA n=1 Tax=Candidatus Iainarchaeum sp. TaxID=3101447 RepID=A0A2D6M0U9_9ARCH|nr:potassium transporter TrkA [Candidatus Diapherotrites archaeon]|tara:strand:+ start:1747 stop:2397 length:651 start_codon:yes stop_codon:yes gene_type:complete
MYIILVGAGEIGYYLAQLLLEEEHDVVVIDKSAERCDKISKELDIIATQGDGTETGVLEKAGVKECGAIVALTGQDETNMIISLLAKELGAAQVAARISKVDYDEEVLKKLGVDIVIHPEAAAAGYIAELITKPEVLDLAFISRGTAEIMEIEITEKSKIAGKKVKEIEHPPGAAIVALFEGKNLVIPDSETLVKPGQKILILAKREIAEKVRKII